MWDSPQGHGHVIERNRIVNCARGIGLGMSADVYDTMIRNNMIFSEHPASSEHDVGIILERGHDSQVFNNTPSSSLLRALTRTPSSTAGARRPTWSCATT
jgi:hypothetical protein